MSDKDREFNRQLQELIASKPQMVEDFRGEAYRDLPVEKINTLGPIQPLTKGSDFQADQIIREARKDALRKTANPDVLDYGILRKEYTEKAKQARQALNSGRKLLGAVPVLGAISNVVPSAVDVVEGNPNIAAARMITGLAPAGTGDLDSKLMEQAHIADKAPELQDPTYLKTLQAIGQRRSSMGKSPVVESFSGQQVDTSATEDNDFMNKVKAKMRENSQG